MRFSIFDLRLRKRRGGWRAGVGFFGDVGFEQLGAEDGLVAQAQAESFDESVELDLAEVLLVLEEGNLLVGEFFENRNPKT